MQDFFDAYPYLVAGLVGLFFVGLGLALAPSPHRRWMLLSGLLLIPFSLSGPLFDGPYWHPKRVGGGMWGVEGVLFCFTVGSIAWVSGAVPMASRLSPPVRLDWQRFFQRSVKLILLGLFLFGLGRAIGLGVMASTITAQAATALVLVMVHPPVWPFQALAAAGHTAIYGIIVMVASWLTESYPGLCGAGRKSGAFTSRGCLWKSGCG